MYYRCSANMLFSVIFLLFSCIISHRIGVDKIASTLKLSVWVWRYYFHVEHLWTHCSFSFPQETVILVVAPPWKCKNLKITSFLTYEHVDGQMVFHAPSKIGRNQSRVGAYKNMVFNVWQELLLWKTQQTLFPLLTPFLKNCFSTPLFFNCFSLPAFLLLLIFLSKFGMNLKS